MKNHKLTGIHFFPFEDDLMHRILDSEIQKKGDHLYECLRLWSGFNRYFWAFCLALICFFATNPINATAGEYKLQIDFSFDIQAIPGKQVTGYRLYKENEPACDTGVCSSSSIGWTAADTSLL